MISLKHLLRSAGSVLAVLLIIIGSPVLTAQTNCPNVQINFDVPSVVCFDPNNSIVDLDVEVIGGSGNGTGEWSGNNITNTAAGIFRTTFAAPGEQKVYYTYTEGSCVYQDSTTFLYSKLSTPVFLASSEQAGHLCQDSFSILRVISSYDATNTNLVWDLAGGTAVEQGGPDSLHVNWNSPGSKLIRLQYEQFGCLSQPIIQQVILDPVIDTPAVYCDNTLDQVVYEWEDPPNSSATVIFVISGPNGVADTVEDRYTISNLLPGQVVQVRLVTTSDNTCDGNFIDPICEAVSCDGSLIDLAPIDKVCVSSGMTDTIDLDYTLYDTITPSTLTWSGAGIFDPNQARIVVDATMAGATQWVYVQFESANCIVTDSVSFELIPPPVADFSIPATACVGEPVTANFTFGPLPAGSDTVLIWDFGDAEVTGNPDLGTPELSWDSPGTKTISLALQDGACTSSEVFRFVNVQSGPEAAQISCAASSNSVLFSWQPIAGATFDVVVLEGPPGVRVSTTSYEISGLIAGQNVTIEVTTNGAGLCNTTTTTASCTPLLCPDVELTINPIDSFCVGGGPLNRVLTADIIGGNGTGTLTWSGPGVSGNVWEPDASLDNQTITIMAVYEEAGCTFEATHDVWVELTPLSIFELDATSSCQNGITTVVVTAPNPATAVYDWRINNISDPSLVGPGPHNISWDVAGQQVIDLQISSEICGFSHSFQMVEVQPVLPAPLLSCAAGPDQILFTWDPVPGASAYEVEILQGPMGDRTSDTSMLFTGLMPGATVEIAVVIENGTDCPESRSTLSCIASDCPQATVMIDRNLLPDQICIDDRDTSFQLDAIITGGDGSGTLVFSGTGVSDTDRTWSVTPAMAGQTHRITATYTEGGCVYTDAADVLVNALPTADFTVDSLACPGDLIVIEFTGQAPAATTFNWSVAGISGPGPHQVTYDENSHSLIELNLVHGNCMTETIQREVRPVAMHPAPVISCNPSLDEILFTWAAPATGMRTAVIWNGPGMGTQTSDTSFLVTDLPAETATDISVQFIDDQYPCRSSEAITGSCVTTACDALSLTWSAPATICQGEAVSISFTAQGAGATGFDIVIDQNGQPFAYSGINTGSMLTFDIDSETTFTITAADIPGNNSCPIGLPDPLTVMVESGTGSGTQTIFPEICAATDSLIAFSSLLDMMPSGGTWVLNSGPENPGTAFDPLSATLRTGSLRAGLYYFNYQLSGNGTCPDGTSTVQIEIQDPPVANAGPDLSLDCQFNIASLGSNLTSPGKIYQWSGSNSTALSDPDMAITDVTQAGTYTLEVTDPSTGCSATDEVNVSAAPGTITLHTSLRPISCYDQSDGMIIVDSVTGSQGPYQFVLNGNDYGNRSVFTNLTPGNYDLRVISSEGCEATALLRLETPVELVVALDTDIRADDLKVSAGDSVQLMASVNIPDDQIASIRWLTAEGSTAGGGLSQMVYPTISSSYGVEITDVNGCTASARISIVVSQHSGTYMPTAFSPNEDGQNDMFYLQSDQTVQEVLQFSIHDRWGKQVFFNRQFAPNDPNQGWDGNTGSQPEPSGVYVYWAELQLTSGQLIQISGDVALIR